MPKVELRKNESSQNLMRRFRKTVSQSGLLREVRKRRWFVSKAEQRRIDKKKAIRRIQRKSRMSRNSQKRR